MLQERSSQFNIYQLFENNLTIPEYQRPYSWNDEQVTDLLDDLIEAYENKKDNYLIGNMIFYRNKNKIELVDGQQRSTTIALILKVLNYKVEFLNQKVNTLSIKSIQKNYNLIKNRLENYSRKEDFLEYLKNKIIVTTINTNDIDEAFMLFDSQNTRGKPLSKKDLLKVHHLRFVNNYKTQKSLAKKWEDITMKNTQNNNYDKIDELLYLIALSRIASRGMLKTDDMVYINVFKEFKSIGNYNKLNNYNQPPIFENFFYDIDNKELSLISKSFDLRGFFKIANGLKYLPFELNQSIEGGEKFFWFVFKYNELFYQMGEEKIFNILDNLSGNGNIYLRKIYKGLLLFFVDKFGFDKIEEFGCRLLILLFFYRFKKQAIRKDGIVKFQWNNNVKFDIFKEILLNYSSEYLLQKIDTYINFNISKVDEEIKGVKKSFYNSFEIYHNKIEKISEGKICPIQS